MLKEAHLGISRIKSLMRSYIYWPNIDKGIKRLVKARRGCALAAKFPPVKFHHWPMTDTTGSSLHVDFADEISAFYYRILVENFSK